MRLPIVSVFVISALVVPTCAILIATDPVWAADLPPGTGRDIIATACTQCHDISQVTSQQQTKMQWTETVNEMLANGASIADKDVPTVIDYLAKNFGPKGSAIAPPAP